MRVGDAANAAVLVNTGAFLAVVVGNSLGLWSVTSVSFNRDGFCIRDPDDPLISSHALCFYVDTLAAVVLWWLARAYAGTPGVAGTTVESAAAGVFGHGCAHLGLARGFIRSSGDPPLAVAWVPGAPPVDFLALSKKISFLVLFFWLLLRTVPSVGSRHALIHSVWASVVLATAVPPQFGFTYVQTVLLWIAAAYELLRPAKSKDRFYDLSAVLVNLPVGLVSWAEALLCERGFKAAGGHVWYDASIPLSMFAYYAVVIATSDSTTRPKKE